MSDIKRIDIKEFREKGYLQEVNRCFLHPLGLAIEIVIEEDGTEKLGGIWDYRDDEEGIHFGLKDSDKDRIDSFLKKKAYVSTKRIEKASTRIDMFGEIIEPIIKNEG